MNNKFRERRAQLVIADIPYNFSKNKNQWKQLN